MTIRQGAPRAAGGYTAASAAVVDILRQRSRPYLFSNTVAPAVVGASLEALALLQESTALRDRLMANTARFRHAMTAARPTPARPGTLWCAPVDGAHLLLAGAKRLLSQWRITRVSWARTTRKQRLGVGRGTAESWAGCAAAWHGGPWA